VCAIEVSAEDQELICFYFSDPCHLVVKTVEQNRLDLVSALLRRNVPQFVLVEHRDQHGVVSADRQIFKKVHGRKIGHSGDAGLWSFVVRHSLLLLSLSMLIFLSNG
jgi:hypothetical protein